MPPTPDSRPSLLLSTVVTMSVAVLWCALRLVIFGHLVLPLTFVIPLLVCVWSGRRWQLWTMATIFLVSAYIKSRFVLPGEALSPQNHVSYMGAMMFNTIVGAVAIHFIISLRERLELRNAVISQQNAELEAQAEKLAQQNEEIRAQNEELAEQNEEIEAQSEEVTRQNEELADANERLNSREQILQGLLEAARNPNAAEQVLTILSRRTLDVMGAPAFAVGILVQEGEDLAVQAQAHVPGSRGLPGRWPQKGSICQLVLEEDKTAYVSDLAQRADLAEPFGSGGGCGSVLATPLRVSGRAGGVLVVCSAKEAHWTEEQFRMVEWVAAQAGLVIETRRWQQLLTQRAHDVEQASRAKDNFLAALSHELRMPLTPILMTAAALREDQRLPEDVRQQLGMMERNISLEARLIDDLLDLTRIAKGKLPLRPQLCDAHSLISLAMEIVRDDAQEKGLVLERDFSAQRSGLVADPSRFQQVIWNLLRNAVKFTPPGGRIAIRTRDEDGDEPRLRIEVEDSGIGIPPDVMNEIFEPFEQGKVGGDHRYGGLGLGLAIARAIVDLHHGTIAAQSGGPNQGATFIVELPGATEPPAGLADGGNVMPGGAEGAPVAEGDMSAIPLRILLVEDHEATLQVLSRLLIRTGYDVTAVSGTSAALMEAAERSFDLVISDLGLPDGSGNELMEKLRDQHGLRGIALSGYGMEEDIERSRKSGFVAHMVKPVDLTQLRRTIAAVIKESAEEMK
jgi:signal transduction histidine kinase/ActR/RegA family two-component response regulator